MSLVFAPRKFIRNNSGPFYPLPSFRIESIPSQHIPLNSATHVQAQSIRGSTVEMILRMAPIES